VWQATDMRVHSGYPHLVAGTGANPEWKWAYASVISAGIFALVCFGALDFMDGMAGGSALGGREV
jgi:hypothetical protein